MKTIQKYFNEYEKFHKTSGNKISHVIGIPLIVWGLLGLLQLWVPIPKYTWLTPALVLWGLVNLFYLRLHLWLGGSMVFSTAVLYYLSALVSWKINLALFLIGWAAQLAGHKFYEHKSPAFLNNFVHLLIGPIYIQNYLLGMDLD